MIYACTAGRSRSSAVPALQMCVDDGHVRNLSDLVVLMISYLFPDNIFNQNSHALTFQLSHILIHPHAHQGATRMTIFPESMDSACILSCLGGVKTMASVSSSAASFESTSNTTAPAV